MNYHFVTLSFTNNHTEEVSKPALHYTSLIPILQFIEQIDSGPHADGKFRLKGYLVINGKDALGSARRPGFIED